MIVRAFRLAKPRHAAHAWSGEGARVHGGRWNAPGTRVVYASGSVALAALELLVHLETPVLLDAYDLHEARFDSRLVVTLPPHALPEDWRSDPAPPSVRALGDGWVRRSESAVLRVPSAVVAEEPNYLLNPDHRRFREVERLRPRRFRFDPRLAPAPAEPAAGRRPGRPR